METLIEKLVRELRGLMAEEIAIGEEADRRRCQAGGLRRRVYISNSILILQYNYCVLDDRLRPPLTMGSAESGSFRRLVIQNETGASIGMQQRRGYSAFSSRDLNVAKVGFQILKFDRSHI